MISVTKAIKLIENTSDKMPAKKKPIEKVLGAVLAEDIISPINMPPFKQSSMDGYAFIHSENTEFKIKGEVPAGSSENFEISVNKAIRIFTGSRIPNDADTVVMQEHTTRKGNQLIINKIPEKGANVRPIGNQIQKGEIALKKGTLLNEAAIGFLAGLGIPEVNVYKKPRVSILVTGNELQEVGNQLQEGQVYDSNSITLKLALKRLGINKVTTAKVKDTYKATYKAISKHLKKSDIILISGGISVGDYDFVQKALIDNDVNEIFYKVNQKPGKPLWFGSKENTKVFALPGNPASSLSCFYVYVLPLVRTSLGVENPYLPKSTAVATSDIKNIHGKTLFLKGNVENGEATLLDGQASSMLKSFAICNALLVVPDDVTLIKKGEIIEYIKLN
ncbi:molybdopterin molybdochelatase [Tenacibaculum skagerrakense]|uniref:Molybdopterin molybdenumtransferase n=1 Tax=Tenacibaculum skagerrakense TaxID=186571 RepID=A0A4R2NV62_9FLAO|nr:gephyrin-like molybdotransferase Glp [Tenacibaculum skagerrakense]TCP25890.1 molybdopterin molybdochelatase [Tenacibaculum skagerrakense]